MAGQILGGPLDYIVKRFSTSGRFGPFRGTIERCRRWHEGGFWSV